MHTGVWYEELKERGHIEDLDIEGGNIIIDLKEIRWNPIELIELPRDRERWRTFVKKAMKLRDLKNYVNSFKD
jgi:hypothetical protein